MKDMILLVVFCCISSSLATTIGLKLRQCEGELTYKRLSGNFTEDDSRTTFYMNKPAENERDCVMMCYERLQFCYSIKFIPKSKEPNSDGTCYFGYYHADCGRNDKEIGDQYSDPFDQKPSIIGCIKCQVQKPSFVQDFDETNRLGPALLIQPASPQSKHVTESVATTVPQDVRENLAYREYKTLNYLLASCDKNLTYSIQPTLLVSSATVFTAVANSLNVKDCAEICYRQQFCVSAIWRENECLLSYQRAPCSDKLFPSGYVPAVLISCIRCK